MIVAVLDTNALASGVAGFVRPTSIPGELLRAWLAGQYQLVVSAHILTELERTLAKPYFSARLPAGQAERAIALLREVAQLVTPAAQVQGVASHPADDVVVATAVRGQAGYLVTGDTKLLGVGHYQGITLLSPRAFLAVLTPPPVPEDEAGGHQR